VIDASYLTTRYSSVEIHEMPVTAYFSRIHEVPDYSLVIHAASLVGPAGILSYAGVIGEDIVNSTSQVIKYCVANRVPLVNFSSAEVYGVSGVLTESMDIRVPYTYNARLEYALGKLTSESMIVNSKTRGLRATIIRPFNVVGPRQSRKAGFVLPTFVQQALAGAPLTVFESGTQKRAFTDVSDIVDFVLHYAENAFDNPHPTFNLGNPANVTTVLELARRIKTLLGSKSEIIYTDGKTVYGPHYFEAESFLKLPDIARAKALGWNPKIPLDDVILNAAQFFSENHDPRETDAKRRIA
jgi:nucleoside-diphosphate-sugar epimerase